MADEPKRIIIKKVKKRHQDAHGGSWKVAYADFVTALMALFLLLWLLAMISPEKRALLSQYFKHFSVFKESGQSVIQGHSSLLDRDGGVAAKKMLGSERADISPEMLQERIKGAIAEKLSSLEDQVMVSIADDGVKIQIVDTEGSLMFKLGSAQPTEKARQLLKLLAENISDTANRIVIEGHTDSLPYRGAQITNWELSTARASAARRELENNGVEPSRIARVVGYADQELLIKDEPTNPRNRRISIILLKEKAAQPADTTGPDAQNPAETAGTAVK
ncbi:MAG: OmpA family protein [Syntrophobacterales bacterium]|nr:OmpA family protein [Syntrophobacterales bacterium]